MSDPTHNMQVLTQYLLGTLPETETERLDELSLTDGEFAESLSAAENDLVDAYVRGELTNGDLQRFHSYYLDSPLRREKVAFAQTLQSWPERAEARAPRRPAGWLATWRWSFAGLVLLLIVAGGLQIQNLRLRRQMTQAQAQHDQLLQRERSAAAQAEQELARVRAERARVEEAPSEVIVASLILTPPMRGAGKIPAITLRPETNLVSILMELEGDDYSAYHVALDDPATNRVLWHSDGLEPSTSTDRAFIAVSFPARLLTPQNYTLRVSGLRAGVTEAVGDYPFRVLR